MILVNLKIYKETFGEGAVRLARICGEVAKETGVRVIVTASALDAVRLAKETGAEIWLQHVDEFSEGRGTGWVSMTQAKALGIGGSLLNHSEHQLAKGTAVKTTKHRPKGFEIMLTAKTLGQMERWAVRARPNWILYEPPELIANKEESVATAKAEYIKKAVVLCGKIPLIVGAGVKSGEDARVSKQMGAAGVGVSSAVVLAEDPKKVLTGIAQGMR